MFSFDRPNFEQFLSEYARVLLSIPQATAVYYIGASVWASSDGSQLQICPNFIVRTDKPEWENIQGMPIGHANHDIIRQADEIELSRFRDSWDKTGWIYQLRVIEVPASNRWAGPEYLYRIEDGTSVERRQETLRRYNAQTQRLNPPVHYYSVDESFSLVEYK